MEKQPSYEYLTDNEERKGIIKQRYDHMEKRAIAFLEESNLLDVVYLNHGILNIVILDYFADIDRLKPFEEISRVNKNKISAYMAYWWLRRKPLQVIKDDINNERLAYINEEFIAALLTKDFMAKKSKALFDIDVCKRFIAHIIYHLKYRVYTPQTIEWMLMAVDTGIVIGKTNTEDC